jgi:hypothetical protein
MIQVQAHQSVFCMNDLDDFFNFIDTFGLVNAKAISQMLQGDIWGYMDTMDAG